MPEGGEGALVVVPGGSEVGTSTVGGVHTPSCLGGGGSRDGCVHTYKHTHMTQKGNGTHTVRKMGPTFM